MPHRVLTLKEASEFLHIAESELERLAKFDEIPHYRNGNKLVFPKIEIDAWASRELLDSSDKQLEDFHRESSKAKAHNISPGHAFIEELLPPECIEQALASKTKNRVLRDMVALAGQSGLVYAPEDLLETLVEREAMRSTALEAGVALLHPRHHDPYMFGDSFLALAHAERPIGFGAPDGEQTDIFFLVCCQADDIHLHVLARLGMMCLKTDLLDELRAAQSGAEMREIVIASELEVIKGL